PGWRFVPPPGCLHGELGCIVPPVGTHLELVVVTGSLVSTHALPPAGVVCLGRGDDCDIRIENTSVSRRHALLHLASSLRIEDLGSANGTSVPESARPVDADGTHPLRRLSSETFSVAVGARVNLGNTTIVIRRLAGDDDDLVQRDPGM